MDDTRTFRRVLFHCFVVGITVWPVVSRSATISIVADTTWRSIGPVGDLSGQPIGDVADPARVGRAWEEANVGWNTDLIYDDSGPSAGTSAVWHDAIFIFNTTSVIWPDGDGFSGSSPAYFRKRFAINGVPAAGSLNLSVDDDAQVYINGVLVLNDMSGMTTDVMNLDIGLTLRTGPNLIAIKAHDSFGGGRGLEPLALHVIIPLPSAVVSGGCLLAGAALVAVGRRRR